MKNKFILSVLLGGSLLLNGCTKELFQSPQTEKETGRFLSNETEVEEYINAVYGNLQFNGLYGLYMPAIAEIPSDNTYDEVPANDNGIYGQLDLFSVIPGNQIIDNVWQDSYKGIQKANVVLNRIDPIGYANAATKAARKGEMLFIRALLYFNLVRLFGDVPLVTQETKDPNVYFGQGRTPAAQVYEQIRKDLTDAISLLPVSSTQPGRVVRTAAQTLLAKVYLTQQDYANARTLLLAVTTAGRHRLMDQPGQVFDINNENNAEIIFAVQFASNINGNNEGSIMFQQFSPSGTQTGAKGHNLPNKSLYKLYSNTDKRRGVYIDVTANSIPYSKKLSKPTNVITDGGSDVVVLRYADVLLMLAEAENELGHTDAAKPYLNAIRSRAGLDDTSAGDQVSMRAAIALERQLELIGEGHRWFDLLRTGMAIDVMNKWFKDNGILLQIDVHHLLMPIPQRQVDTDAAIKQNPGYN
ncbi:RagB/SusD family nutrient uptake outer membrane protein [Chitinophaga pendula]|uniref:RagB/SusD family nutrient uptake outer membrane protein n=1 Tax=Chitinophaga TaxID=79328 RepID=UPI000BB08FFC|nr:MULTISPECIES: RagB/SusD family nutrient uptake outer membrane protein [Chitinophaga]ASZ12286.1 RagB/SusD family nutrient uptake outer membrane protein [Chitinophaga sp. MD30]UCJ10125.1 RagB/SusD family nutrient uptake outer membrane protein [Chitinophaga pendula]